MIYVKEFKTGDTERKCPNCGHYQVVEHDWYENEHTTEPYSGWRFWKSTRTTITTRNSGNGLGCNHCGWRDRYDNDEEAEG